MLPDTDTCAHLSVDHDGLCPDGHPHGTWVCRDCDAEFVPASWMDDVEESHVNLAAVVRSLGLQVLVLRAILMLLTAFLIGHSFGGILL